MQRILIKLVLIALAAVAGWLVAAAVYGAGSDPQAAEGVPGDGRLTVLDNGSMWRWHVTWRTPAIGTAADAHEPKVELYEDRPGVGRWIRTDFSYPTPLWRLCTPARFCQWAVTSTKSALHAGLAAL